MTELTARELLTHLFETAVDTVDGRRLLQELCVENRSPVFSHCIAIGKAAPAMLQGTLDCQHSIKSALLISAREYIPRELRKNKSINILESTHPVPDQLCLNAGAELISYLKAIPEGSGVLVLISGGTSSMVEVPVQGYSLEQIQQINEYLLASGMDIHAMNAWRKCFSQIKGGGLLAYTDHVDITQLIISDVQGNNPAVIGSGLLVQSDVDERIADDWLQSMVSHSEPDLKFYNPVDTRVIGNIELAARSTAEEAERMGIDSIYHEKFIDGDAIVQGRAIGEKLISAPAGVHVWGGETTLHLPENPGLGGRNLTLALAMAEVLDQQKDIAVLVAGTDGIDGNTTCAGAIISGETKQKAEQMGFDIGAELAKANAGTVLMATDDLFQPGPSNTNVMDIIIAYKRN